MTLYVGTSGWQYADWRGRFYPPGLPQRKWLEYHATRFVTVEVNNAFYRLPERSVFEQWRARTPPGFVVAVKASRYLTHIRRLRDPAEPVARLMERATGLGDRLGPVLLQLPPTLRAEPALLAECLECFPAGVRVAVEPRHDSWWTDEVRAVLGRHGAALCWADRLGRPVTPLWRTADWGYLRMHEGRAQPRPRYGRRSLRTWAERVTSTWGGGEDAYVYFNNDPGGAAVTDAEAFIATARTVGAPVAALAGQAAGQCRAVEVQVVVGDVTAQARAEGRAAGPPEGVAPSGGGGPGGAGAGAGGGVGERAGLAPAMLAALARADALLGHPVPVSSGLRTRAEQQALWDRRATNPYPVARPSTSDHETGLAVDVPRRAVSEVLRVAADAGLCQPLPTSDPVHFVVCGT